MALSGRDREVYRTCVTGRGDTYPAQPRRRLGVLTAIAGIFAGAIRFTTPRLPRMRNGDQRHGTAGCRLDLRTRPLAPAASAGRCLPSGHTRGGRKARTARARIPACRSLAKLSPSGTIEQGPLHV